MPKIVFGNKPETILRAAPKQSGTVKNHVLLGTYLEVVDEPANGDWLKVQPRNAGKGGWVHKDDVRDDPGLKVFYVDVKQGDGAIVEYPDGILLIDGGPGSSYYKFLKHRYGPLLDELQPGETVHIDHIVVSHPDQDHYEGFIGLLNDTRFSFGTIFHNGIIRYSASNLPPDRDFDLGRTAKRTVNGRKEEVLTELENSLGDFEQLVVSDVLRTARGNKTVFHKFWEAAVTAHQQGRLRGAKRITSRNETLPGFADKQDGKLFIEVWGPVPTKPSGSIEYVGFPKTHDMEPDRAPDDDSPKIESSHTRNGHSIVLKLHFGEHSFLFGGDLNIPAQCHLMEHYGNDNPFKCDVAKACHHGSSDFHVGFLKKVLPHANVVSSGDNKSFDHPVADAVGALARHTDGDIPLFFSTELARAQSKDGSVHYGLINARSNGTVLTMAQMKEQRKGKKDIWDSFTVPWKGRFEDILERKRNPANN